MFPITTVFANIGSWIIEIKQLMALILQLAIKPLQKRAQTENAHLDSHTPVRDLTTLQRHSIPPVGLTTQQSLAA